MSRSSNAYLVFRFIGVVLIGVGAAMPGPSMLLPNIGSTTFAQQTSGPPLITFPITIQWLKQTGVSKYRLQIADDENFRNVFYDGPVVGDRYTVSELSPGYYYWRIAPAERQTGAFVKPVRFFVSGGVVVSGFPSASRGARPSVTTAPASRARSKGF